MYLSINFFINFNDVPRSLKSESERW